MVGKADGPLLDPAEQPRQRMVQRDAELGSVELRHELVEVQQDGRSAPACADRGEDERVRHRVDLHDIVRPAERTQGDGRRRQGEEGAILPEISDDPPPQMPNGQARDLDPTDGLAPRLPRLDRAEHLHPMPGRDKGGRLAPHARIGRVARVPEDEDVQGAPWH